MLQRREEQLSLELHKRVLTHAETDKSTVQRIALKNIARAHHLVRGNRNHRILELWADAVTRESPALLRYLCTSEEEYGIEARQLGPFAGVLTEAERLEIVNRVHRIWRMSVGLGRVR